MPKNPKTPVMLPTIVGFMFPSLETMNPDNVETMNRTTMNGSWTSTTLTASPPNPSFCP